ncbi:MAG: hypothetical protein AB8H80_21935 [Planctomycetota bacterium]
MSGRSKALLLAAVTTAAIAAVVTLSGAGQAEPVPEAPAATELLSGGHGIPQRATFDAGAMLASQRRSLGPNSDGEEDNASCERLMAWLQGRGAVMQRLANDEADAFVTQAMEEIDGYPAQERFRDGDPLLNKLTTEQLISRKLDQVEAMQSGHYAAFELSPAFAKEVGNARGEVRLLQEAMRRFPQFYICSHYGFRSYLFTFVAKEGSDTRLADIRLADRRHLVGSHDH